jgi:hypothetical protein
MPEFIWRGAADLAKFIPLMVDFECANIFQGGNFNKLKNYGKN